MSGSEGMACTFNPASCRHASLSVPPACSACCCWRADSSAAASQVLGSQDLLQLISRLLDGGQGLELRDWANCSLVGPLWHQALLGLRLPLAIRWSAPTGERVRALALGNLPVRTFGPACRLRLYVTGAAEPTLPADE
ncbi:hypothetical protein WJX72_006434 [[Myrmecia] bisecta]|uniref:Uncharacterized protein n=1 Tax=[Myrmecia] bisecta TaxID=41462 RepID=A0AAW1R841_9CHLO